MVITQDDCEVCKYLHNDINYTECPKCKSPFIRQTPDEIFQEFKNIVSSMTGTVRSDYFNDIKVSKKINDPKFAGFKIYVFVYDSPFGNDDGKLYFSADPVSEYGIDENIIHKMFKPIKREIRELKTFINNVLAVECIHSKDKLVAKCSIDYNDYKSHISCPVSIMKRIFSEALHAKHIRELVGKNVDTPNDPYPELTIILSNLDVNMKDLPRITFPKIALDKKYQHIKLCFVPEIPKHHLYADKRGIGCIFTMEYLMSKYPKLKKYNIESIFIQCPQSDKIINGSQYHIIPVGVFQRKCECNGSVNYMCNLCYNHHILNTNVRKYYIDSVTKK